MSPWQLTEIKAAKSVNLASLSPSLFEDLQLQLCAELSSLCGLCSGTAPAQINLIICQSPHRCGCLLYIVITDSSLRLGIYDPNNNFHHIFPSEQVTSLPRLL